MKSDNENKEIRIKHPFRVYESLQMIPDILDQCLEKEVVDQIGEVVAQIQTRRITKILLLGRGSSYFASLSLKYMFSAITDIPVFCFVSNSFDTYPTKTIDEKTAVFVLSASGKSEGDKKIVEFAKEKHAYTIAVTDIEGTLLTDSVDDVILGPGGPKIELPATRTYTSVLFRMTQLVLALAKKQGNADETEKLEKALAGIPNFLRKFMPSYEKEVEKNVELIKSCTAFVVLGYGPNIATADEGALAIAQSTRKPGMSFEMENFIHGAMQAVTKDTCVIGIASGGPLQDRMLRTMMAAKTIGAKTMVLLPETSEDLPFADIKVFMSTEVPDLLSPIVYMVPLWQTAYQFGLLGEGGHPDRLMMDTPEFKKAMEYLMKQDRWVQ